MATEKTLAKSVYSLNTSQVTEEDNMEDEKNKSKEESNSDDKSHATKKITIEGMKMLAEQRTRSSEETPMYGSCKENTETSGSNKSREEEAEKNSVCVCFWPPVPRWGPVKHEIPISSLPLDDIPSIP